jgi:hypothetical protein
MCGVQVQVVRQAAARFIDESGGLHEGQGQPIHFPRNLCGDGAILRCGLCERGIRLQALAGTQQQQRSLLGRHFLHFDAGGDLACCLRARGEEDIALTLCGQELLCHAQVVGVVENEQPVLVAGEPAFDGGNHERFILLILWRLGQFKQVSQRDHLGQERLPRIGLQPEDVIVKFAVVVGEFGSRLRFPDASQPEEGLRLGQCGHPFRRELIAELCQHVFAVGEEGVV